MSLIEFTSNYTDHSTENGYQFEFHCDKCGNGFMSTFHANKVGVAGGFLRAASSLFGGGALQGLASASDQVKDSLRGKARDDAFSVAVNEGKQHFKQCHRCGKWVCPEVCWNGGRSLCRNCAPDLMDEAAAAQAAAATEQVWQKARESDQTAGLDMSRPQTGSCPHCGAKSSGGKFCGECGKELQPKTNCPGCKAKLPPNAKFCGECGAKV